MVSTEKDTCMVTWLVRMDTGGRVWLLISDTLLTVAGLTAVEKTMFYRWFRDSNGKVAFPKAIRATFATRGGETMLDTPKGIYEQSPT